MSLIKRACGFTLAVCCAATLMAQTSVVSTPVSMIRIAGTLRGAAGAQTIVFSIYPDESGGAPLWQETQHVSLDAGGSYSALLGISNPEGLPQELFTSGEKRWLGVRLSGTDQAEAARVALASPRGVPAETQATRAEDNVRMIHAAPKVAVGAVANYIPIFTDSLGDLSNSAMYQNGGLIGVNTTAPKDYVHVSFSDLSGGFTGYAVQNTAAGASSYSGMLFYDQNGTIAQFQGFNNSTHEYRINNIASNGSINFMLGTSKFQIRSDGDVNIAGNIRKGGALFLHNIGTQNTAAGLSALNVSTGSNNTAVGYQALIANTTGSNNIAIGSNAGSALTTGSNNIDIGNVGVAAESNAIRIGVQGTQTKAYVAGIYGTTVTGGATVMVDSNGQLGIASSSRRFKTDIADMGDASADLFKLRPVTFQYKEHPEGALEYGLIAEEVAEVFPDLVLKDSKGRVEGVQYHKLTPMLLNELQKERASTAEKLAARDAALKAEQALNRTLLERVTALETLLQGASAVPAK